MGGGAETVIFLYLPQGNGRGEDLLFIDMLHRAQEKSFFLFRYRFFYYCLPSHLLTVKRILMCNISPWHIANIYLQPYTPRDTWRARGNTTGNGL